MKIRSFSNGNELGGNMILLEEGGTRILLDFGENLDQIQRFFGGSLRPRQANGIEDYLEMNILPDLNGLYRKDFLRHVGKTPSEEPHVDALILSHAHRDHVKFLPFLRADIPIYCSEATKKILEWVEEQRKYKGLNHFTEVKKKFWFRRSKKNWKKKIRVRKEKPEGSRIEREFNLVGNGESTTIGDFEVTAKEVNHPIPGSMGFLIESPSSRVVYTGDMEGDMNGEHKTTEFIRAAKEFDPNILITEATAAGNETQRRNSYVDIDDEIEETDSLALLKFSESDVKRLERVLEAAKRDDRRLAIKPSQAMLIKKLEDAGLTDGLSLDDPNIVSFIYQIGWGTISNKVRSPSGEWQKISDMNWEVKKMEDVLRCDFNYRFPSEFFEDHEYITPEGISHAQEDLAVFTSYAGLINLIDFQPKEGSKYIHIGNTIDHGKSYKEEIINRWLDRFGVEKVKLHIPSHIMHSEIEKVVEQVDPDKVVPVHTRAPEKLNCGSREKIVPEKGKEYEL